MNQSTPEHAEDRVVLLQHGGELSEFARLLSEFSVPVQVRTGDLPEADELEGVRLVVVSGKRLLDSDAPNLRAWPRTIAVIDDSSRTLVAHLGRVGVAMVIRRPIHPRTLRLLLVHEIYRGPERRTPKRTLIGHPIRVGSGLRKPRATLLELSTSGALIELANPPEIGSKIRILLGKDLTQGKAITLEAKVLRVIRSSENAGRADSEIGVEILAAYQHETVIKSILNRFALGPASWLSKRRGTVTGSPTAVTPEETAPQEISATEPNSSPPPAGSTSPEPELPESSGPTIEIQVEETKRPESEIPVFADAANTADVTGVTNGADTSNVSVDVEVAGYAEVAVDADAVEVAEPAIVDDRCERSETSELRETAEEASIWESERRQGARVPYDRRIVALDEEAARVLVGRDLSRGGMRIATNRSVRIGDVLRIALHSGSQSNPLMVIAKASRDDGNEMILTFDDLSPAQLDQLEKIVGSDHSVHAKAEDFETLGVSTDGIVIAEMIGTISPTSDSRKDADLD